MPRTSKRVEHVEENAKPKRVPLHEQPRNMLTVEGLPKGYKGRWVLDIKQRVQRFKQAGWENVRYGDLEIGDRTVHTPKGKHENDLVQLGTNGGEDQLYLMMIKKEWYDEDQAAKQAEIDRYEHSMVVEEPKDKGFTGEIRIRK